MSVNKAATRKSSEPRKGGDDWLWHGFAIHYWLLGALAISVAVTKALPTVFNWMSPLMGN